MKSPRRPRNWGKGRSRAAAKRRAKRGFPSVWAAVDRWLAAVQSDRWKNVAKFAAYCEQAR